MSRWGAPGEGLSGLSEWTPCTPCPVPTHLRCPSPSLTDFGYLFGFPEEIGGFDLVGEGCSLVLQRVGEDFWVKWGPQNRGCGKGFLPRAELVLMFWAVLWRLYGYHEIFVPVGIC